MTDDAASSDPPQAPLWRYIPLEQVALTSPYLHVERPVAVVMAEKLWGTHYRLKAYPIEGREQAQFTSDLTVRSKAALAERGVRPAIATAVAQGE